MDPLVVFALDGRRLALPLRCVERALRVVAVTPLPKAPAIVCGVINVQGQIIPVIDLRRRFGLPDKASALSDQLLIARTQRFTLAMIVDEVAGVAEIEAHDCVAAGDVVAGTEYVQGIVKLDDGMLLIHDLETFLSLDEERSLADALAAGD